MALVNRGLAARIKASPLWSRALVPFLISCRDVNMNKERRSITLHLVPEDCKPSLEVSGEGRVGVGGAPITYRIQLPNLDCTYLKFQEGPVPTEGVNGITMEALLVVVIDRLTCFQAGPYPCADSAHALTYAKVTLAALKNRTQVRIARAVEGQLIP
jgi:hypothetical protein